MINRIFLIAIAGMVLLVACNRTTKEATKKNATVTKNVYKPATPKMESYNQFYKRFHRDSAFQVSRIKFPMKGHYTDSVGDLHKWNTGNWIMHRSMIQTVDTSIYKVKTDETSNFKAEMLYIEGGGFKVERKFKRINGKWYLVYYTDENL